MKSIEIGHKILGYTLTKHISGKGSFGDVYLGVKGERKVAVKVLKEDHRNNSEFRQRFIQEFKAIKEVGFINYVNVMEELDESIPAFSMVYIDGQSLQQRIENNKLQPLTIKETLQLYAKLLTAFEELHSRKIYHRDIKPSNIMLFNNGEPRIIDFGIAKIQKDIFSAEHTSLGWVAGTKLYMSPEQFKDSTQIDHRSDIYSLGVILYQLLAGCLPYGDNNITNDFIENPFYPPIEHISKNLQLVVNKAINKSTNLRFNSCKEFRNALKNTDEGEGVIWTELKIEPIPESLSSCNIGTETKISQKYSWHILGLIFLAILLYFLFPHQSQPTPKLTSINPDSLFRVGKSQIQHPTNSEESFNKGLLNIEKAVSLDSNYKVVATNFLLSTITQKKWNCNNKYEKKIILNFLYTIQNFNKSSKIIKQINDCENHSK